MKRKPIVLFALLFLMITGCTQTNENRPTEETAPSVKVTPNPEHYYQKTLEELPLEGHLQNFQIDVEEKTTVNLILDIYEYGEKISQSHFVSTASKGEPNQIGWGYQKRAGKLVNLFIYGPSSSLKTKAEVPFLSEEASGMWLQSTISNEGMTLEQGVPTNIGLFQYKEGTGSMSGGRLNEENVIQNYIETNDGVILFRITVEEEEAPQS